MNKRIFTVSVLVSVIAIASLFSAYVAAPQSQGMDVLFIRMVENNAQGSVINIIDGSETINLEIEKYDKKDENDDANKSFKALSNVLDEYVAKGYNISSSTSLPLNSSGNTFALVHDYVLVK